jgi:hypothetical protein
MTSSGGGSRSRTLALVVFALVFVLGLMGVSFAIGLHAGVERTALFTLVKDLKVKVEGLIGRNAASAPPPVEHQESSIVRLYDDVSIAREQAENQPPADYADWIGFYRMTNRPKDLDGLQPTNVALAPVINARLQPWAIAKMEATDGEADDTGQICQPTGLFRATSVGGFLFLPDPVTTRLVNSTIETGGVQRVYMKRTHPRNLRPTWNGDSIGYWEGDTLVVDTIGFNDKSWLQSTMQPHTEEARMIQRIRRVKNGKFLEIHYTVEDRKALTSAYTYVRYYQKESESMPEVVCNDDLQVWREFRNTALERQRTRAREVRE